MLKQQHTATPAPGVLLTREQSDRLLRIVNRVSTGFQELSVWLDDVAQLSSAGRRAHSVTRGGGAEDAAPFTHEPGAAHAPFGADPISEAVVEAKALLQAIRSLEL